MKRPIEQIENDFRNKNIKATSKYMQSKRWLHNSAKNKKLEQKEYFNELLNKKPHDKTNKEQQVVHTAVIYVEEPIFDEVVLA